MRSGGSSVSFDRIYGRALALAACCCVLLLSAYAQTGVQEKADDAALELKLSTYEASVCKGSSLTLSLEITNTGRRRLKILREDLWRGFAYSEIGGTRAGAEVGCGGGDGGTPGGWIVLEPGDKYFDTRDYRLDATSFFKDAGRYKLSTSMSYYVADRQGKAAISNGAEFEVQDCAAK